MTPEQLEAQSREAIKAWCDDPSVQLESTPIDVPEGWGLKIYSRNAFDLDRYHYRIAKPRKWYRVGECDDGEPIVVFNESDEQRQERAPYFDRWLDERRYYD